MTYTMFRNRKERTIPDYSDLMTQVFEDDTEMLYALNRIYEEDTEVAATEEDVQEYRRKVTQKWFKEVLNDRSYNWC